MSHGLFVVIGDRWSSGRSSSTARNRIERAITASTGAMESLTTLSDESARVMLWATVNEVMTPTRRHGLRT